MSNKAVEEDELVAEEADGGEDEVGLQPVMLKAQRGTLSGGGGRALRGISEEEWRGI